MTAIYVSHDLAVVAQMADKILVLLKGQIAEYGTTQQLLEFACFRLYPRSDGGGSPG